MCWTTHREASEAAVAVAAAAGRSSDSDSFGDQPIHTNDDKKQQPSSTSLCEKISSRGSFVGFSVRSFRAL